MKDEQTTQQPAPEVHEEIQAHRFTLVDEAGRTRAHLTAAGSETVLAMYAPRGGLRLAIHAGERESTVSIFNKYAGLDEGRRGDSVELIRLGYEGHTGTRPLPRLRIADSEDDERITLQVGNNGGEIFLTDDLGGRYSSIGADGMSVYDVDNNLLANFCVSAEESADAEGEEPPPAPTFEQARDKMIGAMQELIEHPDATPAFVRWADHFGSTLLRRLGETDEALKNEADTHPSQTEDSKPAAPDHGVNNDDAGPVPDATHTGGRNQMLASLAASLRRQGLSESVILKVLQTANQEHCQPPLSTREVEAIAHNQPAPAPAPINTFNVAAQFNELTARLAISLQNDDLLYDFIRFAFAISDEADYLKREAMALTVGGHAFTRTCEFSAHLDRIVGTPNAA